jgi:acetyltransferase-like isoleucine patch superfamily enzyme
MFGVGGFIKGYFRKIKYLKRKVYIASAKSIHHSFVCESPISIGKNTAISENVRMGRYSYIGSGNISCNTIIGRYCSIGGNVAIGPGSHPLDWLSTSSAQYNAAEFKNVSNIETSYSYDGEKETTIIGNDVWIGNNAVIMKGVTVQDGSVIGAGAVVTKDVPPYAIVVGVPAKVLRYRFDNEKIEKLLQLKWWENDFSEIKDLPFDNVNKCIEELERKKAELCAKSY